MDGIAGIAVADGIDSDSAVDNVDAAVGIGVAVAVAVAAGDNAVGVDAAVVCAAGDWHVDAVDVNSNS